MAGNTHDWLWTKYLQTEDLLGREPVALDFGCGQGRLIQRALDAGSRQFFGAETYYGDEAITADAEASIPVETRDRIAIIGDDGRLPFPDSHFDFVCTSQVFEHIPHLAPVINELARVTRPDGVHFHALPTREALVEGHVDIPILHRLHGERRRKWARLFYKHGRAKFSGETRSFDEWWSEFGPFLSDRTFHRPWSEFEAAFRQRFEVRHMEKDKLIYHMRARGGAVARLADVLRLAPPLALAALERRRAGVAIELRLAP